LPVVTISRTFGAGGAPVGRELARRLGAEFLDRNIVAMAAQRAGISEEEARGYDERMPGVWQRVATVLATSGSEFDLPVVPETQDVPGLGTEERLAHLTQAIIEEASATGNAVIVGRGGAFILHGRPDVLHVQLHAPLDVRVRNLVGRVEEIPDDARPDEASLRDLCRSMDARRAEYIRRLFRVDWLGMENYDLTIDTDRVGLMGAVDVIQSALAAVAARGTSSRQASA
jgi:cytidylate kinase